MPDNALTHRSASGRFALTWSSPVSLVVWTIIISGVIRLAAGAGVDYGFGEGYYVATARHLALSYFDQPPVALWVAWVMI